MLFYGLIGNYTISIIMYILIASLNESNWINVALNLQQLWINALLFQDNYSGILYHFQSIINACLWAFLHISEKYCIKLALTMKKAHERLAQMPLFMSFFSVWNIYAIRWNYSFKKWFTSHFIMSNNCKFYTQNKNTRINEIINY